MRNSKEIAEYLKLARQLRGLTVTELANRLGVTKGAVSRYENGSRKISMDDIPKYATVLGVTPLEILLKKEEIKQELDKTTEGMKYNYLPLPVDDNTVYLNKDSFRENLQLITIPDAIMGEYAGRKDICITHMRDASMDKTISNDSLVVIEEIENNDINHNDIIVYFQDDSYHVRRYLKDDRENKIILRPESNDMKYADVVIDAKTETIEVVGKVIFHVNTL